LAYPCELTPGRKDYHTDFRLGIDRSAVRSFIAYHAREQIFRRSIGDILEEQLVHRITCDDANGIPLGFQEHVNYNECSQLLVTAAQRPSGTKPITSSRRTTHDLEAGDDPK